MGYLGPAGVGDDMTGPLRIEAGDLTTDEILEAMRDGRRVLVTLEFSGSVHEVALRYDGERYLCDTPLRLHRHEDEADMRACIERMGYAADE